MERLKAGRYISPIDWIIGVSEDVEEEIDTPNIIENPDIAGRYTLSLVLCRTTRVWLWIPQWVAMTFADELLRIEDVGALFGHECLG